MALPFLKNIIKPDQMLMARALSSCARQHASSEKRDLLPASWLSWPLEVLKRFYSFAAIFLWPFGLIVLISVAGLETAVIYLVTGEQKKRNCSGTHVHGNTQR